MEELKSKPSNKKEEDANRLKRELRYAIERFIRDKGEIESKIYDAKIANKALSMVKESDNYEKIKKSIGKNKADDLMWKKYKEDATISTFTEDYPEVVEILIKQIKDNGGYYEW